MNLCQLLRAAGFAVLFVATLVSCGDSDRPPLTLGFLSSNQDFEGFKKANEVLSIEFPRDHGSHQEFATEWWYVTGIVRTREQRAFGFQYTLFRSGLASPPEVTDSNPWRSGEVFMAHFAVLDIDSQDHVSYERFSRGHPELAFVQSEPFVAALGDWVFRSTSEDFSPLALRASAEAYSLDFEVIQTRSPVLHGDHGLSWKSTTNASYYYSIPRLAVQGKLQTPAGSFAVQGTAWMDHEWSTGLLDPAYKGWYWLHLQLKDQSDLVLFSLVPNLEETEVSPVGMTIDSNNATRHLQPTEWSMNPTRYWKDYPIEWQVELNGRRIEITTPVDDQLMTTSIRYWEGVVFAEENGRTIGEGFLELTGY